LDGLPRGIPDPRRWCREGISFLQKAVKYFAAFRNYLPSLVTPSLFLCSCKKEKPTTCTAHKSFLKFFQEKS
jgi:hypothetical protein